MNRVVQTSGPTSTYDGFHPIDSLRARLHHWIVRASNSQACALLLKYRRMVLIVGQLGLVVLSNYLAFTLRFDGRIPAVEFARFVEFLPWLLITRGLAFWPFRVYEGLWKYTGISDVCNILQAVAISSAVCLVLVVRPEYLGYPRSVILIDSLLLTLMLTGVRLTRRLVERIGPSRDGRRRVLVYGAGDAGAMIVGGMREDPYGYVPVGFVDDNPGKIGTYIHGVRVLGRRADLPRLLLREKPDEVLIAMPGTDRVTIRKIVQLLEPFKVPIKTLPGLRDILDGRVDVTQIRDLTVEDLLTRSPVDLNVEPVRELITGSRVLVTGAGGSIGSELARQVAALAPASLVLYERYENTLHDLVNDLNGRFGSGCVQPVIGDVTDTIHVRQVMEQFSPQIVFHAAAHKHVPLMEQNPCEAIKNNVVGTATVAQAALDFGVDRFIFISTDKAVNPSSVMGASKRIAEQILQGLSARGRTRFSAVRFGNVLGSNGSVLPRFIDQIKAGGPVTVTHPEMRRYFMLIPEAVQLVLHAATLGEPGMTYVLEMGDQIKLVDLARHVIRLAGFVPEKEIPITFIGLRPGEKLYEELVGNAELAEPSPIPKINRVRSTSIEDPRAFERDLQAVVGSAVNGDPALVLAKLRQMLPTLAAQTAYASNIDPPRAEPEWSSTLRAAAVGLLLAAAVGAGVVPASAQTPEPTDTALRAGPFRFAPAVALSNLGYDSNANNRSQDNQPQSDWTSTITPSLDTWVQSPNVRAYMHNQLDMYYFRDLNDLQSNDPTNLGRLQVYMSRVSLYGSAAKVITRHQENLEIDALARRDEATVSAGGEVKVSGKTSFEAFVTRSRLEYAPHSIYLDTDLARVMNHTENRVGGAFRYAATPLTSMRLTVDRAEDDFDSAIGRNAEDLRVVPSVEFSPFALISGSAAIGIQRRVFYVASNRRRFTDPVARVDLMATLAERTRLSVSATSQLEYSYLQELANYLQTGFNVELEQALGPQWSVSASVGRYRLNYRQLIQVPGNEVPDETALTSGGEVRYRFSKARIGARIDYRKRDSDEPTVYRGYERLRAGLVMSYGF